MTPRGLSPLMDAIRIPGRANRARLRHHAIKAVIPVKKDQKKHRRDRGRAGGRPPVFDASWYKKQHCHARHGPPG